MRTDNVQDNGYFRDYWVYGLYPSSGVLKNTTKHKVSETGSLTVLKYVGGRHPLGPLERANLN
jgi:hypothetical protein